MRFLSKHRSYTLIVVPTDYSMEHGRRRTIRGLRATFVENEFDSYRAQAQNRWTDEERILVEEELLANETFGFRYWLDDSDAATPVMQTTSGDAAGKCQVTFMTPEGSVKCRNSVKVGSDFCAAHQNVAHRLASPTAEPEPAEASPVKTEA